MPRNKRHPAVAALPVKPSRTGRPKLMNTSVALTTQQRLRFARVYRYLLSTDKPTIKTTEGKPDPVTA